MGLVHGPAVDRPLRYHRVDSRLRSELQSGQVELPLLQSQDQRADAGSWINIDVTGSGSPSVATFRGQNTVIEDIQWRVDSAGDWSYTITVNGYEVQSGTGTASTSFVSITKDFSGRLLKPTDSVVMTATLTAGAGPTAHIKVSGWNIT